MHRTISINDIHTHLSATEWQTVCEVAAYEGLTAEQFCTDYLLTADHEGPIDLQDLACQIAADAVRLQKLSK